MSRDTIISVIIGGAFAFGSSSVVAQTFGLEYTTEWQTDFKRGYDWLNLLKISTRVPVYRDLALEGSTISTVKCGSKTLIDDLLTYSNIEAGNIPLTFARLGFNLTTGNAQLFMGINNVNDDYFTSELTSFFTNSSCGISPTISCNYDIANYPLAAWCIHYRQLIGNVSFQTSLYPGKGYSRLGGHDNLFGCRLGRDGIFSISSIDYNRNGIYCVLGVALHYGVCIDDETGEQIETPSPAAQKRFSTAPWILSEIGLPYDLGLIAHGSFSTVRHGCKGYAGIGLIYNGKHVQPGISFNHAFFSETREEALELSARIPVFSGHAFIQPSIHLIQTDKDSPRCIGMMRLNWSL